MISALISSNSKPDDMRINHKWIYMVELHYRLGYYGADDCTLNLLMVNYPIQLYSSIELIPPLDVFHQYARMTKQTASSYMLIRLCKRDLSTT